MKELLEKMFKDDNIFLSLRHNDGTFLGKIVHDRKLKCFYYIEIKHTAIPLALDDGFQCSRIRRSKILL